MKVCHLTSVHPRNDIRIFLKECQSLEKAGYDVSFVVADGLGDEQQNGIQIHDVGKPSNRFFRIMFTTWLVFFKAIKRKSIIYHFHDPELFPVALLLRILGKHVIFDVHENVVEQIKEKHWLPSFLRFFLSNVFQIINVISARIFYLILAEKSYKEIYQGYRSLDELTTVLNYPKLDFFTNYINTNREGSEFFYIGGVSNARGLDVIVEAFNILDKQRIVFTMHFIGPITDNVDFDKFPNLKGKIKLYGRMPLVKGYEISKNCVAGLAVLKPIGNYVKSYPTKVFEYMAVGLPIITSNFSLYKQIVEKHNVGVCVNPESPEEVANAILNIIKSSADSEVGERGIKVVNEQFAWRKEEKKLLNLYDKLMRS